MTLCAVSLSSETHHVPLHYGLYPAEASSNLHEKTVHFPCGLNAKILASKGKVVRLLRQERARPLTSIVSAIQNGNNESDSTLGACADDQPQITSEKSRSSVNPEKETVASLIYSSPDHSQQHAEILENQGNLLDKLKAVQMHALAMEQWNASRLKLCHRRHFVSAANLIHYLALRSLDVDQLKDDLSSVGLLNLETINPYVIASLSAGIQMLENLKSNFVDGDKRVKRVPTNTDFTINSMTNRAVSNRDILLGPLQDERTHIMVTIGEEAIDNETLISDIIKKGTTIIRINCAHGNTSVWSEIIRRVRTSSQMLEKPCRVLMDLAGPKLRTGRMKPGPCVVKISPKKDPCGKVTEPARVWLAPRGAGAPPAHISPDVTLHVDGEEFLGNLKVGDIVRFSDARGKRRTFKIASKFPIFSGVGFLAECTKTGYIHTGMNLYVKGDKKRLPIGFVVDVPPVETSVRLKVGDLLVISRHSSNEQNGSKSSTIDTPRVTCSSGYLFDSVKPGEPIAFDDGKIWGIIKGTSISEIVVSITHAGPRGTKLGPEKSINIPESKIRYEGLTSKDIVDLDFVGTHADIVGISFVRDVRDIVLLRQELEKRKLKRLGVVLKIETKDGLKNLPIMLLEAMKLPNPLGVMIARGDLAVECGWEVMADIQEQIISICSAAHVPVIWATQVLESLVKTGVPTRAEITDVACGRRANCIMLNKGKHILEAISTLDTMLKSSSTKVNAEVKPLVLSNHLY